MRFWMQSNVCLRVTIHHLINFFTTWARRHWESLPTYCNENSAMHPLSNEKSKEVGCVVTLSLSFGLALKFTSLPKGCIPSVIHYILVVYWVQLSLDRRYLTLLVKWSHPDSSRYPILWTILGGDCNMAKSHVMGGPHAFPPICALSNKHPVK